MTEPEETTLWESAVRRVKQLRTAESTIRNPTRAANPLDLTSDDADVPMAFPGIGPASSSPLEPGRVAQEPVVPANGPRPGPDTSATTRESDVAARPGPRQTAEPAAAAKTVEELLAELDALTGLTAVKAEIHRQVQLLRVEKLRNEAGLRSPTITRHLVFVGNPGTGKTTVARLVGGIYRALGLLSKGQLVEVDRSELVAGYLGQTAIKTSEVVGSAVGGVLFIDEAYSLGGDQYGTEAVDTLVKEMEDHRDDLVLIVAGYPDPMVVFIGQNPGLSSRFRTSIEFGDYADDELAAIFTGLAAGADYDVTEPCLTRFRSILATTPRGPAFGNGRFARNHLEAAIGRHAWRLRDVEEPTLQQLRELLADDLDDGAAEPPADPAAAVTTPEPDPVAELFADATEAPRVRAPDASAPDDPWREDRP